MLLILNAVLTTVRTWQCYDIEARVLSKFEALDVCDDQCN